MVMRAQTNNEKAMREWAQTVVDKALDILLTRDDEVAWEGFGLIGRFLDFHGQIPRSSGYSEVCQLAARVDRMRSWPRDYREAFALFWQLSDNQKWALGYDRARRGRQIAVAEDPFRGPLIITYDDRRCADELGCTISQFRSRVYDGYKRLESLLAGNCTS